MPLAPLFTPYSHRSGPGSGSRSCQDISSPKPRNSGPPQGGDQPPFSRGVGDKASRRQ